MEFNQKSENSWLENTSTLQSTVDSYLIQLIHAQERNMLRRFVS